MDEIELSEKLAIFLEDKKYSDIKKSSNRISESYRLNSGSGKAIIKDNNDSIAYSICRMPATFCACRRVVKELTLLKDLEIKSILDVGAGTGSASLALMEEFGGASYTLIERDRNMLNIAKIFIDGTFINDDIKTLKISDFYDIVIASYSLNELKHEDRINTIKKLYNQTNKFFIIVDAGTPQNYKDLMEVRDEIIKLGATVIAPCSGNYNCPINRQNDWCHFSVRVKRSRLHKNFKDAKLGYEDEKFTYMIFSKTNLEGLNNYLRIVRHPVYRPKVIDFKTCSNEGIKNYCITKTNKDYKKYKDLEWGDRINDNN